MDEAEVSAGQITEREAVWEHRVKMFRLLGFNPYQRRHLADSAADWHDAKDLIDAGCPVDIAFDILS